MPGMGRHAVGILVWLLLGGAVSACVAPDAPEERVGRDEYELTDIYAARAPYRTGSMRHLVMWVASNDPQGWQNLGGPPPWDLIRKRIYWADGTDTLVQKPPIPCDKVTFEQHEAMLRDWQNGVYTTRPRLYAAYATPDTGDPNQNDFILMITWMEEDMDAQGIILRRRGALDGKLVKFEVPFFDSPEPPDEKRTFWQPPYKTTRPYVLMRVTADQAAQHAGVSEIKEIVEQAKQVEPPGFYWWGIQVPIGALEGLGLEVAVYDAAGNQSNWMPLRLGNTQGNLAHVIDGDWVECGWRPADEAEP